ncbi:MAG: hypothetical protein ACWGOY_11180 [Anaerolineales bacterium]
MDRRAIILIVLGVLILSTACAQQGSLPLIGDTTNSDITAASGDEIQLQQEGLGPLEITPLPPGEEPSFAPPAEGESGNISSKGERTTAGVSGNQPGMIDSKPPGELNLEQETPPSVGWATYRDPEFHFSIQYPQNLVVLPDQNLRIGSTPGLLHEVRFLDEQLAGSDTAELEVPQFSIAIYNQGDQSLEAFLDANQVRGKRESYTQGNLSGLRVTLNQLIAPNEFYYFTEHGYVYKLTPLSTYGQEMLESFQVQ